MMKQRQRMQYSLQHKHKHPKQKKSHKRSKQKRNKHNKSRSRSRSNNSCSEKDEINRNISIDNKNSEQGHKIKVQKNVSSNQKRKSNLFPHRNLVNSNVLANIISDQKKLNRKLDQEEIKRAANNFKQNFVEDIKPITMSSFLSNEQLIKKVESKQIKGPLQCQQGSLDFPRDHQLQFHDCYKTQKRIE